MEEKEINLFRLLGYYNDPAKVLVGKSLSDEEKLLAENLKTTFSNINDPNESINGSFCKAVKDYIFLLKDKNARLYQYWPKNNLIIAQPEGSQMDKVNYVSLALEYKSWFAPGEQIVIGILGTANIFTQYQSFFLYDFLRTFSKPGSWIEIKSISNANTEPVKGAIQVVGKDFVIIKTKDLKTICATKNMNIQIGNSEELSNMDNVEDSLEPMGTVSDLNPKIIIIKGNTGKIYQGKSSNAIEPLRQGDKVYFTPNGKYANFIHKAGTINYCYNLAKEKIDSNSHNEGKEILKHILECFPDNSSAADLLSSLLHGNDASERSRKYFDATVKWNGGQKEVACRIFNELLTEENKTGDDTIDEGCIKYLAKYYVEKYVESRDEDDKTFAIDFIEENYLKINEKDANNDKLVLYYKLGCYQVCLDLIDFELDDKSLSNYDKGRLYYYKSQNFNRLGRYDESEKWAIKSLSINPFGNNAEKNLSISDHFTVGFSRPYCDGNLLYSILTNQIAENSKKSDSESILQKAELWELDSKDDYSFLPIAAVLDEKNSNKFFLEYLYRKASDTYEENPESSVFIWKQIFSMVPGYGYFNHIVLLDALSTILEASSSENEETIDGVLSTKIEESTTITEQEWKSIILSISENKDIIDVVFNAVKANNRLMVLFRQYITSIDPTIIVGEMDGSAIIQKIIPILERKDRDAVEKLNKIVPATYTLEDIVNGLSVLDHYDYPFNELHFSDDVNWVSLYESILPLLNEYQNESDIREREDLYEHIAHLISELFLDVFNAPTYFSLLGIGHILELIYQSLKKRQGIFDEANLPKLSISITTNTITPDRNGYYRIGIHVENGKDLSTAENVSLNLVSKVIGYSNKNNLNKTELKAGNILGGGGYDGFFKIKLPQTITKKSSFGFAISYKTICKGRPIKGTVNPLQVRFPIDGCAFEPINDQPYKPGAGLPYNDPTFFGRDVEVRTIVNKILNNNGQIGTQLIVYGQARCGKSSLLNCVQGVLNKEHADLFWCVKGQLLLEIPNGKTEYEESDFFYEILKMIEVDLNKIDTQIKPTILIPDFNKEERPAEAFKNAIIDFKTSMKSTPGWENRNLVLILDEFSAIYNRINASKDNANKDNAYKVSDQVLFHWKGIQESSDSSFATIFIGHDTTPRFFAEPYAVNAASIIDRMRITYLTDEAADKLIQEPILTSDGKSRFDKEAVQRIKDYTACNPFHIQQFMQSVIKHINANQIIRVSRWDVDEIATNCVNLKEDNFCTQECFDNLISPGIDEKYREIKNEMYKLVLKTIATLNTARTIDDWCELSDVNSRLYGQVKDVDAVIKDLVEREVIEKKSSNNENGILVRIKVLLFKLWLLKN